MANWSYSDEELRRYFSDRGSRSNPDGWRNRWLTRLAGDSPGKRQAVGALAVIAAVGVLGVFLVLVFFLLIAGDLPDTSQIENPRLQLATVAYTADGVELQRYARQNRSWVDYQDISPAVIHALVATEDHRFYRHWGIDLFRTMAIPYHVLRGDPQGGSTITQQLARNLYNEQIGREVSPARKLKEMVTAVQLERRYSKAEILQMYLNTVEFGQNAFGLDAAARTFFAKTPAELDTLEAAVLVGMQQAITRYNPIRNPESSRQRRNVVLSQMVKNGYLTRAYYDSVKAMPIVTDYRSSEITEGIAPHFAEYVRQFIGEWCQSNGCDPYADGLVVYTTLDSRLQAAAVAAAERQAEGLQAVVDYEWSRSNGYEIGLTTDAYVKQVDYTPFEYFWDSQQETVDSFIRETERFRLLRKDGVSASDAMAQLKADENFADSLRAEKTRLEVGVVSIDPRNGHVKAWVGGRDLSVDWFDHVALAKRQPGSTFKPFVYTAAIDNGYSPYHTLQDTTFTYVDVAGNEWSPGNSGDTGSGEMMTLREGLAQSKNTITSRLILQITPTAVARYARLMGIESKLDEVPALALGVSDVSLLELTSAYSTIAFRGLYNEPLVVTRIEDKHGIVIYEAQHQRATEALSERTAVTMIDMLRAVVREGTGRRLNAQFGLGEWDLAGKTGTTQNNGDGWFVGMYPELVTGAWVGFNDRRVSFRSDWWGQGAHNALLIVGDYLRTVLNDPETGLTKVSFPTPTDYGLPLGPLDPSQEGYDDILQDKDNRREQGRVGW